MPAQKEEIPVLEMHTRQNRWRMFSLNLQEQMGRRTGMIAILKREWKSYFQNITGWLFIAAVLALYGLYF